MIDVFGVKLYWRKRIPRGVATLTPTGGATEKIGIAPLATCR